MQDMLNRLVHTPSVYSVSEPQEHAVQCVVFTSLRLLFIQKISKKGGRRMSRRMASKDPPSTLETACQTHVIENFHSILLFLFLLFHVTLHISQIPRYVPFLSFAFVFEPLSLSPPGPRAFRRAAKKAPLTALKSC